MIGQAPGNLSGRRGGVGCYTDASKPTPPEYGVGPIFIDGALHYSDASSYSALSANASNIFFNVKDYGAVGDGVADDTTAFDNALAAAYASVKQPFSIQGDDANGYEYGGAVVYVPFGIYSISDIEIPYNVTLRGDGSRNSVLTSSFDGQIIRSQAGGAYNNRAGGIHDLKVLGDRSKANQVGLDIMRCGAGFSIARVEVSSCGSHGIMLRECLSLTLYDCYSIGNVGHGYYLTEGLTNWGAGSSNLPSNANALYSCVADRNDGAGIRIEDSNGNIVSGGYYQNSYQSSGNNIGNNIELGGDSRGNVLTGTWTEGKVNAHIYIDVDVVSTVHPALIVRDHTHIASTGTNRAVICNSGVVFLYDMYGNTLAYPTINASNAPFRCTKSGSTGRISYKGTAHLGTGKNGVSCIEDEDGDDWDLQLYAHSETTNAGKKIQHGGAHHYVYNQADNQEKYFASSGSGWDSSPWLEFNGISNKIVLGDGASNDAEIHVSTATPESSITAPPGSICLNTGGGAGTSFYVKESGTGNTGWVAK